MANIEAKIYDQDGKEIGMMPLPSNIFGVAVRESVIHDVVVAQQLNARAGTANTKTRGEVRGGGRKPWKQKGTGRARHGSSRSPIWIGGGITFGPRKERNYTVKINHKARQKALKMVLSDKVSEERIVIVDSLEHIAKTKALKQLLTKLPWGDKRLIVSLDSHMDNTMKAARNLKNISLIAPDSLNVVDALKVDAIVMSKKAIERTIATLTAPVK